MSESLRSEIIGLLSKYEVAWGDDVLTDRGIQFRIGDQPVVLSFDTEEDVVTLLSDKLRELAVNQKGELSHEPPHVGAGRYTVFQSDKVIAIECEHGLTVPPGNILVIPLTRPNRLIDLTKGQFQGLFLDNGAQPHAPPPPKETAPVVEPPVEQPEQPEPPSPPPRRQIDDGEEEMRRFTEASLVGDVFRFLEKQPDPLQTVTVASRLRMSVPSANESLRELQARGVVVLERGFWRLKSRPAPPPPVRAPRKPNPFASTSRLSIPPQLGRILAAMAYASHVTGDRDLTTKKVKPYLPPRDMPQYSARLPGAIEKGLVERGEPLGETRGWHYRLTAKGLEAARQLEGDIYEQDRIAVPGWLDELKG